MPHFFRFGSNLILFLRSTTVSDPKYLSFSLSNFSISAANYQVTIRLHRLKGIFHEVDLSSDTGYRSLLPNLLPGSDDLIEWLTELGMLFDLCLCAYFKKYNSVTDG